VPDKRKMSLEGSKINHRRLINTNGIPKILATDFMKIDYLIAQTYYQRWNRGFLE